MWTIFVVTLLLRNSGSGAVATTHVGYYTTLQACEAAAAPLRPSVKLDVGGEIRQAATCILTDRR